MRRAAAFAVSYWLVVLLALAPLLGARSIGPSLLLPLIVMALLQWMLLVVPSRVRSGAPVSPRLLPVPLHASGLLLGFLVFGLETAVGEYLRLLNKVSIWIWIAPAAAWAAYALAMHRRSLHTPVARLAREHAGALVIAGTVVLLLAIPAHILTVRRGGFIVGIGTALGVIIAVLTILLALGQLLFTRIFPGEALPRRPFLPPDQK